MKKLLFTAFMVLAAVGAKAQGYLSADYAMMELKGKVKKVSVWRHIADRDGNITERMEDAHVTTFDKNGRILTGGPGDMKFEDMDLQRDEQGRLLKYEQIGVETDEMSGFESRSSYVYNGLLPVSYEDEFLGEISAFATGAYFYNEDGWLKKSIRNGISDGIFFTYVVWYQDQEPYEANQNWTRRLVIDHALSYEMDGADNPAEQSVSINYYVEEREIEYY